MQQQLPPGAQNARRDDVGWVIYICVTRIRRPTNAGMTLGHRGAEVKTALLRPPLILTMRMKLGFYFSHHLSLVF